MKINDKITISVNRIHLDYTEFSEWRQMQQKDFLEDYSELRLQELLVLTSVLL